MAHFTDVSHWLFDVKDRGKKGISRDEIDTKFPGDVARQRDAVGQARFHGLRVYHDYRPKHADYGEIRYRETRKLKDHMTQRT